MVDRFDPPRDLDWKPLPMRPDIAGEYVRYTDLAAARAENERLTGERDAQYEENVNRIAMQAKAEAERDEARSMLADAERDMRQRAADELLGTVKRKYGDCRDYRAAILALPLKHADRDGGN